MRRRSAIAAWLPTAGMLLSSLAVVGEAAAAAGAASRPLVWRGQARFTAITDNLIRLEWAADGSFSDEPTAIVGRPAPRGRTKIRRHGDTLVLATKALTVTYRPDGRPFNADNLSITWRDGGRLRQWAPGRPDRGNLGGTSFSLEGVGEADLRPGLLSREGYFLYDDTQSPRWRAAGEWIEPRPAGRRRDWYFCVYGRDYAAGLREWISLTGRVPMLPRWAFGAWYSRYWKYSDRDLREIIARFRAEDVPLDVLVIDTDWRRDDWHGYDWNQRLFPDPAGFLAWVHDQGCKVTLNDHPARISGGDSHYDAMFDHMGLAAPERRDNLELNLAERPTARAFVDVVLNPLLDQGVDFWWIDGACAQMPGLDPELWTSKVFYDGAEAHTGQRALILNRYGGYGSHRYPVGFSGDTASEWEVLNFEVKYTALAGNVAFAYWSHDIGGFHGDRLDPELYVRWVQFGALSPILRLHSNHGIREPWSYGPEALAIARKYFRLRHRLIPYLYSYSRVAHDQGLPLVRPVYLEWPALEDAYRYQHQYLLGRELLVAPIGGPGEHGTARKDIYLPPGGWYDYDTGELHHGPTVLDYPAPLDRCPLFVRAGAVIPMQPAMDYVGQQPADPLTLDVYGGADGAFDLYEDDGTSLDYRAGRFARTPIEFEEDREGDRHIIRIGPTRGRYAGQEERRSYLVRVNHRLPPRSVSLNGERMRRYSTQLGFDRAEAGWHYDRRQTRLEVKAATSIRAAVGLVVAGGVGRDLFEARAAARRYRERAGAALAVARAQGVPDVGAFEQFDEHTRAAAAALTDLSSAGAQQVRAVARLEDEARGLWRRVAATADSAVKGELPAALLGLDVQTWVDPGDDLASATVYVRATTSLPAPGIRLRVDVTPPVGWSGASHAAGTAPAGGGATTLAVVPRRESLRVPGILRFQGALAVEWHGQSASWPVAAEMLAWHPQWFHVIGPFQAADEQGLEIVCPPEQEIDFARSYPGKDGAANWQTTRLALPRSGANSVAIFVDLASRFGPVTDAVAYAVGYLHSATPKDVLFWIGSDDGCVMWLNGEKVYTSREGRSARRPQDYIATTLRAGLNTIMVKVTQRTGDWGFHLRLGSRSDEPMADVWQLPGPVD